MASQTPIPLSTDNLSQFSRAVGRELKDKGVSLSHLEVMNLLARAAGFRNYQHLRAAHAAGERLERPLVSESMDMRLVERALHVFSTDGRLLQWPSRRPVQMLCLWVLWSRLPAATVMSEKEVNGHLLAGHDFGDPALIRRELWGQGMVKRNRDGSDYQRIEQKPPAEALELIRQLGEGRGKA